MWENTARFKGLWQAFEEAKFCRILANFRDLGVFSTGTGKREFYGFSGIGLETRRGKGA
jgi:hypothetical protein